MILVITQVRSTNGIAIDSINELLVSYAVTVVDV